MIEQTGSRLLHMVRKAASMDSSRASIPRFTPVKRIGGCQGRDELEIRKNSFPNVERDVQGSGSELLCRGYGLQVSQL